LSSGISSDTPSSLFSVISGISGATDPWRPPLIVALRTNRDLDIHYCDSADECSFRPPVILKLQNSATIDLPLFWR